MKNIVLSFFVILCFFQLTLIGQENLATSTFEAPNNNLQSVTVSTFQGQPLLFQSKIVSPGQIQFLLLSEIFFMKDYYDVIQTDIPTSGVKKVQWKAIQQKFAGQQAKIQKSNVAQKHLHYSAHFLLSEEGYKKYLCLPGKTCHPSVNLQMRKITTSRWSGYSGDEFDELDCFQQFHQDNLKPILAWSKTLPREVYITRSIKLGQYDFAKGGFPVRVNPQYYGASNLVFAPKADFETWMVPQPEKFETHDGLIKMQKAAAEAWLEKMSSDRRIFVVFKAKLHGVHEGGRQLEQNNTTFQLTSPIVEFYTNNQFDEKIGELSIAPK